MLKTLSLSPVLRIKTKILKRRRVESGVVVHACNPVTQGLRQED
jgi:hypothetical protein